ncbi:hypothetical protein [Ruminococcus sp.]|uniref:hypothetical protein n=1 Tax=Ruminococcus sp. TaxID=41978 RepID=UPI003F10642E
MKTLKFKIVGTQPLMLNNNQTVNPFNEYAKKLKEFTSKRKKTEEDMMALYGLQFESSLYLASDKKTYIIPADHFWKSVCTAAKEVKLGKKFEQSFQIFDDCVLDFPEKSLSPVELYEEGSHVDIRVGTIMGKSKVPVCRAIFNDWQTEVTCHFDESQIDEKDIIKMFEVAGLRYGVGTYRKRFGKFTTKKI